MVIPKRHCICIYYIYVCVCDCLSRGIYVYGYTSKANRHDNYNSLTHVNVYV